MALAETTLAAACSASDTTITVASATSILAGRILQIDDEMFQVTKAYVVASTSVPVIRGQMGTAQVAHVTSARIVHGDGADFGNTGAGQAVNYPLAGRTRRLTSITATSTMTLPLAGTDHVVILNGTSVITLTVPVPTKNLDGTLLYIASNGAAAHVIIFTGGLSGAGDDYKDITVNATGPVLLGPFMAVNELWQGAVAVPMAGTVTNITATVA